MTKKEYNKAWCVANPDKKLAQSRRYYERLKADPVRMQARLARQAAWKAANPDKVAASYARQAANPVRKAKAAAARKATYEARVKYMAAYSLAPKGWDYDRYNWQVMAQGLKCAICRQIPKGKLHADHCHVSGSPRALLCGDCNRALGLLRDDPAIVRSAAVYIEAFGG